MPEYQFPSFGNDYNKNFTSIKLLLTLNSKEIRSKHGGSQKIEILNKSAIVLATTCWEAFIEDLASNAMDFLLKSVDDPRVLPASVLISASNQLIKDKDERKVWDLAGDGWKAVLKAYCDITLSCLNTPSHKNIDRLFENLIGLKKLSNNWKWQGVTNERALTRLDRLITTRGDIAHRLNHDNYITKQDVLDAMKLVMNISVISTNTVREHLLKAVGSEPWGLVVAGEI